jgi:hypothetical protein
MPCAPPSNAREIQDDVFCGTRMIGEIPTALAAWQSCDAVDNESLQSERDHEHALHFSGPKVFATLTLHVPGQ